VKLKKALLLPLLALGLQFMPVIEAWPLGQARYEQEYGVQVQATLDFCMVVKFANRVPLFGS
jgi:hypothetical protein